ncbi:MAG TPA: oxidoreductase [Bacteroidales bacterium]|nr:MAG: hypothetical protein A2X11_07200 [Bacteroidetes bacterium GWE2_42_24]OFY29546.1 MAG: hypothetical protein A2X09_04400 [Bacteroidetes bacterium GWF2_43_11]PKP27562.1 MAG: oxidoreductase [Bacteroidetes bacterium HGW-Bacteroidetes-22]HAQ64751.1 oxidoreductase [Bacteroidales bacterium]HBZ67349.1 oxidoreductase [Bacteroidales bacterium]
MRYQCTVLKNELLAPGVHLISFEKCFPFKAGQMVTIALSVNGPKRLYSIASGEPEAVMSVIFDIKPEGALTPPFALIKPGDTIFCSQPQGSFLGSEEPAFWIASGTGIAPFRSMFRTGLSSNKTLIHGGRFLYSFYFQDELIAMKHNYIRCCTQESGAGIFEGRLTRYLRETPLPVLGFKYYLCGSAEMVVDTRDLLISRSIPFENIISEIYF